MTQLNNLYFGIKLFSLSYSSRKNRKLETYNLFDFAKVKWSVAKYVTMTKEEKRYLFSDSLHFCFGDVFGRCEYEYFIRPKVSDKYDEVETNVFQMYVEPNANLLMEMVNSVSINSAKKYLREEKLRRKNVSA